MSQTEDQTEPAAEEDLPEIRLNVTFGGGCMKCGSIITAVAMLVDPMEDGVGEFPGGGVPSCPTCKDETFIPMEMVGSAMPPWVATIPDEVASPIAEGHLEGEGERPTNEQLTEVLTNLVGPDEEDATDGDS
jgi:hypothetical protein